MQVMKKLSTLLSLIIGVLGKGVRGGGERGLNNGIRGKLLKCLKIWAVLFWRHSLIIIKWDWGKFFPKIDKQITPTIKDKKVTYSNSSFKVWIERKYVIHLIPVKSYKKDFVSCDTDTNHSLKLAKVFSQQPISFKANTSLYSNASQYSWTTKPK